MCSKDAGICPVYIDVLKKIFQSVFFENLSFFCCKFDSADCSTLISPPNLNPPTPLAASPPPGGWGGWDLGGKWVNFCLVCMQFVNICQNFRFMVLWLLMSISRFILGCRLWKLRTCGAYCLYFPMEMSKIDFDEKKFLAYFPIVVGGFLSWGDQKWLNWPIPTALGKIL